MNMQTQTTASASSANGSRAVTVALSTRRLRIVEDVAAQFGPRRTLSPAEALGLVVEWAPAALGALERERALDAARPKLKAYRPDPDAWPASASGAARTAYREGVRCLLGFDREPGGYWRCPDCRLPYDVSFALWGPRDSRRRWWECPSCPTSERRRRRVRGFRQAWDWSGAELAATAEAEAGVRAALLEARYAIAGGRALEARVCKIAGVDREGLEGRPQQHLFRCRSCRSTWRPFAPLRRTSSGEPAPRAGDLRTPLAWWACPKACNARAAAKVARLAGSELERRWLEPVDAAGAAALRWMIRGLAVRVGEPFASGAAR